ncbi:MAG: hypothetical protein ACR2JY_13840 [Chloroflexota bacterium]
MLRLFRLLWSTLGDYYYEILPFTALNLMWLIALLGLPLIGGGIVRAFPVAPALLAFFATLLAIPPALAGLFSAARTFADGYNIGPRDFFLGFRRYFWRSWQLALADLLAGVLVGGNFYFYLHLPGAFKIIAILWVYVVLFWLALQPYLFGLLVYQSDKRLRTTARNAALLVLANLGPSVALLFLAVIFVALSIGLGLPFLALTSIVSAVWFTRALDILLAKYPGAQRMDRAEADEAGADRTLTPRTAPRGGYGARGWR